MQQDINKLFQKYLQQLRDEINEFPTEEHFWEIPAGVLNSAGTICYHLCGNLNHFIGHGMGNTGYVRNRPLEFSIRDVSKEEMLNWIDETATMLAEVIPTVNLDAAYPKEFWGEEMTTGAALLKLLGHFTWHLGQINYLRRMTILG